MLSFIIPTLNEEKRIEGTIIQFDALKKRYDYEVIVSDGGSDDSTAKLARKAGAKVIVNDRKTQNIAKNRNAGARIAKGDILIFFDADTRIKDVVFFVNTVLKKFEDKRIVAGVPRIEVFPDERIWQDFFIHFIFGAHARLTVFLHNPFVGGQCQIVKKKDFFKIGGYDEEKAHAEDTYLFKKLGKIGKIFFFNELIVYESPRRYRKWGYLKLIAVALKSFFYQILLKKNTLKEWEKID